MKTKNVILEVGDEVRIGNDASSEYQGRKGIIQRSADGDGDLRVNIPELNTYSYFKERSLTFVKKGKTFKVNDEVEVFGDMDGNFKTKRAVITEVNYRDNKNRYLFKCIEAENRHFNEINSAYGFDMKILKKGKPFKVNFLLKYDLDSDPVEEYETMAQVKKRIKELSSRSDLRRDSIKVYFIKSVKKIEIKRSISIVGL